MASQGPNSAGTGVNQTGVGGTAWTNPGNIVSSNNTYASCTVPSTGGSTTNYIKGTNFGFSIPSGATIDGIIVEVERVDTNYNVTDSTAKLVKADTIVGTNKALAGQWSNTEGVFTYGSSTDLWGTSWTDTDINATNFGFVLNAFNPSFKSLGLPKVDHIRITVHYTSGGGSTASSLLLGGD